MKDVIPPIKLQETFDAAVLVCYLLNELGGLSEECLLEIVTYDEMVDVFKLSDALGLSERKNLVEPFKKDGELLFKITTDGKTILSEFINSVPLSIREKALEEGRRVVSLNRLKKSFRWGISETERGCFFKVRLLNENGKPDIMQVRIYAPSMESALDMEKRFLEKPVDIIGNTLNMFVSDSFM